MAFEAHTFSAPVCLRPPGVLVAAASPRIDDEARRAASLRRVAIVLKNLPRPVAAKLLGELPVESQQRLQYEVAALDDVDPLEHKRALESFAGTMRRSGSLRPSPPTKNDSVDEIVFSRTAVQTHSPGPPSNPSHSAAVPTTSPATSSFGFLDSISDDDVRGLLQSEHPQTIAVVMASIDPRRAASILPHFPPRERQDILSRIGRLQEFPDSMIEDLASTFRDKAQTLIAKSKSNPLQDLIDAYAPTEGWDPAQAARHVPVEAAAVSPRLKAILSEMPPAGVANPNAAPASPSHAAQPPATIPHPNLAAMNSGQSAVDSVHATPSPQPPASHNDGPATATAANSAPANSSANSGLSTDDIHQRLVKMKPRLLCEALGRVPTRTAMLCLCGLPNKVADAAINVLPRAQAAQVRTQLANVGSMELREIDDAKEAVVIAASSDNSSRAMAA